MYILYMLTCHAIEINEMLILHTAELQYVLIMHRGWGGVKEELNLPTLT